MPLTSAQFQKVERWVTSKKLNPTCPSCGERKWAPLDIISANTVTAKGTKIGGNSIPMVQIACSNCGFIKLYAAVPMGLPYYKYLFSFYVALFCKNLIIEGRKLKFNSTNQRYHSKT